MQKLYVVTRRFRCDDGLFKVILGVYESEAKAKEAVAKQESRSDLAGAAKLLGIRIAHQVDVVGLHEENEP